MGVRCRIELPPTAMRRDRAAADPFTVDSASPVPVADAEV